MSLKNAKVVIIGGSSGIRLATAAAAYNEGADVAILGRSLDKLEQAQTIIDKGVESCVV